MFWTQCSLKTMWICLKNLVFRKFYGFSLFKDKFFQSFIIHLIFFAVMNNKKRAKRFMMYSWLFIIKRFMLDIARFCFRLFMLRSASAGNGIFTDKHFSPLLTPKSTRWQNLLINIFGDSFLFRMIEFHERILFFDRCVSLDATT